MLAVVAFRNLIELSGSDFDFAGGYVLPKSFGWFRGNNVLWTISYVSDQISRLCTVLYHLITARAHCAVL